MSSSPAARTSPAPVLRATTGTAPGPPRDRPSTPSGPWLPPAALVLGQAFVLAVLPSGGQGRSRRNARAARTPAAPGAGCRPAPG